MEQGLTREAIYARLRELEISPEVSDMTAELLEPYSDKKVEAFILWTGGITHEKAAFSADIPRRTFTDFVERIRQEALKNKYMISRYQ